MELTYLFKKNMNFKKNNLQRSITPIWRSKNIAKLQTAWCLGLVSSNPRHFLFRLSLDLYNHHFHLFARLEHILLG